ncbi:hypothetical protein BGZ99_005655 [Dissophora globulifera]|uniref:Uncharacterized protein n=1 Tax=Dissophora globulifera TaxID=979702 RepID=A0A9P6RVB8_9FUNG|nr:hypothetical protein BGZ99_005655 [Dissophora globulifera]
MDFEKATLKKAAVSTLPLWADSELSQQQQQQQHSVRLHSLPEESPTDYASLKPGVASPPALSLDSASSTLGSSSTVKLPSSISNHRAQNSVSSINIPGSTRNHNDGKSLASTSTSLSHKPPPVQVTKANAVSPSSSSASPVSGQHPQDWSVFATMSNVSTISGIAGKYNNNHGGSKSDTFTLGGMLTAEPETITSGSGTHHIFSNLRRGLKLDEIFKTRTMGHIDTNAENTGESFDNNDNHTRHDTNMRNSTATMCTCTCPQHHSHQRSRSGSWFSNSTSKRRNLKETREAMRGYPSGQCLSTDPPEHTNWDDKDSDELSPTLKHHSTAAKNTAFNLEAVKALLNSPLFSSFLKTLTVLAAVSLFAVALDSIIILLHSPDQQTQLSHDNAALIIIVILSLLTIAYSCFTIFLDSRRPPEGLDTSSSKPLIVIFSEIIACIVWAQVLSVTIYIYIWTYGCTAAGRQQLDRLWKQDFADEHLTGRLCRRQGAMVGLELLLVLLLIFNFYTHLALNFKFIRAVS